jgi:hypothetical protein
MRWRVHAKKRTLRLVEKMPRRAQGAFWRLKAVLEESGPTGPHGWRNYGKLKGEANTFHCHLTPDHQWVACWRSEEEIFTIEIFYAGSHQGAPY